jgi:predicted RNA-binding Zn ribbon-like protein
MAGRVPFTLIGGHAALDFVNTLDWRSDPARRVELLVDVDDLIAWALQAGLVGSADARMMKQRALGDGSRRRRTLLRARRLREVLARTLGRRADDQPPAPADLRLLNAFLRAALRRRCVEVQGSAWRWTWAGARRDGLDALLWPIVLAGAELLTSADAARIRQCAGEGCGWLFLDRSRGRRRRWCNMQSCGNRAKARRFYERARSPSRAERH